MSQSWARKLQAYLHNSIKQKIMIISNNNQRICLCCISSFSGNHKKFYCVTILLHSIFAHFGVSHTRLPERPGGSALGVHI